MMITVRSRITLYAGEIAGEKFLGPETNARNESSVLVFHLYSKDIINVTLSIHKIIGSNNTPASIAGS